MVPELLEGEEYSRRTLYGVAHWEPLARTLLLAVAYLQVAFENGVQLSKGAHLLSRCATVKAAVASMVIIVSAAIAGAPH